jgi:pimeloyl-ACP methyl ester carboxylesterase
MAASTALPAQTPPGPASAPTKSVAAVQSRDGTTIAYERSGQGPTLILVASALSTRADAARFAALLAPTFTVVNFDRRGRGESGDTKPYAVEREIEDIEALLEREGGSGFLFGSSSGAALALEAANKLGSKVKALVLFEPPFVVDGSRAPVPDDFFTRVGVLVSDGRRSEAVAAFMKECVGVPAEMLGMMKQAPMWAGLEKVAHTLPYDGAILAGLLAGKPLPGKRWTSLTARTLVIDGELSDPWLRNAVQALTGVLPNSKRRTLPGQDHSAVFMAPQTLVPVLVEFLRDDAARSLARDGR